MSSDAIAESRRILGDMLKARVPRKVNEGGHQTALAFKKAIDKARKALASQRSTSQSLHEAISGLRAYQD